MKENMKPFEILFFDVGFGEIMKNVSGWIGSPERVQGIKTRLDAIKDVQSKKI